VNDFREEKKMIQTRSKTLQNEIEELEMKIRELEEKLESGGDSREIGEVDESYTFCPKCKRKAELDVNGICYQC